MKRAVSLQKSLQANYGGTEMVNPFTHLYGWKAIKGYQKQVGTYEFSITHVRKLFILVLLIHCNI